MADANEVLPPVAVGESAATILTTAPLTEPSASDVPSAIPATVAAAVLADAATGTSTPGGAGTGASTPAMTQEQIDKSLKVSLADLSAKGTALYAQKKYDEAAEVFSRAAEMQAEINGDDMSPDNAEILFLYGRALYYVALKKSDVFGGNAPEIGGEKKAAPAERGAARADFEKEATREEIKPFSRNPFIQIGNGDADESDEDEDEDEAPDGEDGKDDDDDCGDLGNAYEILDVARVLFEKQLATAVEEADTSKGKEADQGDTPSVRHIKERLGDTHELLADISLEGERYHEAIPDFRKSLAYKKELYPQASHYISGAHFKLSLALEFASIVAQPDGGDMGGVQHVNQNLRGEAAAEMEAAIESCRLKLQGMEVDVATNHSPEENDMTRGKISDLKEMVVEMEDRLAELRAKPLRVEALLGEDKGVIGGILGEALGETPEQVAARIEEAKKTATDLTGLVRKKAAPAAATNGSNGKRKLEETETEPQESKKARVEDAPAEA